MAESKEPRVSEPPQKLALDANRVSNLVIGACIEVHRTLGPGLLESAYEECVAHELDLRGIAYVRQRPLRVEYKGIFLEAAYRLDLVVADNVIVELKAVDALLPVHQAQILTYLKLTGLTLGLLINFNLPILRDGIKRVANRLPENTVAPK